MKLKITSLVLLSILTMMSFSHTAKAESVEKDVVIEAQEELEKQNNENLINKIETAQKEQFLKFMLKKQNVQDSEYI